MLKLICIVFFIRYIQLYLNFIYVPKIIFDILTAVSAVDDISNKLTKAQSIYCCFRRRTQKNRSFQTWTALLYGSPKGWSVFFFYLFNFLNCFRNLIIYLLFLIIVTVIERLKEEALQYKGKDKRLMMEELKRYNCSIRIILIVPLFTLLLLFFLFIVN